MARNEFSKATKREALRRSGGKCEAIGSWYGLPAGEYCNAPLAKGVEFDHIVLDANSKNNSLNNCAAVCIRCHKFKTAKHDIPVAAKTLRQQDRHLGIRKPATLKSAGFPKKPRNTDKLPLPPRRMLWGASSNPEIGDSE